jgi:uncharacterized repeat protein (TIGR03803 family)
LSPFTTMVSRAIVSPSLGSYPDKEISMKVLHAGCMLGGFLCLALSLSAQTFKTLVSFNGSNGETPATSLVQGFNGNFYATTYKGGADSDGTVFQVTRAGALTTLYSFFDGEYSISPEGLVQATNGTLYGTTSQGGAGANCLVGLGCGTVFKITPAGALTTLYSFCSEVNCDDGTGPSAMLEANDGNFYGVTTVGGANGEGTVFEITSAGKLTTLYSFCSLAGCADGSRPSAALVQATNGNFYGTTGGGGANTSCINGCGTIFKITPSGVLTTLYNFCSQANCADGYLSYGALVQASNGNFYGTTNAGGASAHCFYPPTCGTVFEFTPAGELTTLYNFCSETDCTDGQGTFAALVQATDGDLYGTTLWGGAGDGTVFRITLAGALTTLHSFQGTDGSGPDAGLVQATNGTFYGATDGGGANNDGTIFGLSTGLKPFVETLPTSGEVGAAVKILGTNLAGATAVTFNGTVAVFKVVSSSEIATTVPKGATTGKVQVTTPVGTLTSNANFRVP